MNSPANRAERWSAQGGENAVLRLEIPPDLARERTFEISCSMTVQPNAAANSPWHELRVFADGALEWSRRIATAQPSPYDGLEMRFRRTLVPGQRLMLLVESNGGGVRRLSLAIEAEEC